VAGTYWPRTQIIDNFLYVPTINGIYRKDLTALNTGNWELYAFEGMPVRDFIKNEDTIMAATAIFTDKNVLLLSTDDGLTYTDYTHKYFMELDVEDRCTILRLAQNPQNHGIIMALHEGNTGVSLSADFGVNWSLSSNFIGGYQDRFIGFNPNDVSNVFYTGETEFEESYIKATYDNGATWTTVESVRSHCTHGIAFHPFDKNIMVAYGEGRISKSVNQGMTWTTGESVPLYVYKAVYDPDNPDVLYASGDIHGDSDILYIYRSTDGGESWHLFYEEKIENSDGILDIHLHNGKLIIYTLVNGVYYLDLGTTGINQVEHEIQLAVYPNPAELYLIITGNSVVKNVKIYDSQGKLVSAETLNKTRATVYLDKLSAGLYFLLIDTENGLMRKKVLKK
jgi:photosystem II stability/assembly factor-like uncharacterized protein